MTSSYAGGNTLVRELNLEVQEWLAKHNIKYELQGKTTSTIANKINETTELLVPEYEHLEIFFNDPEDEMLFKLTWC